MWRKSHGYNEEMVLFMRPPSLFWGLGEALMQQPITIFISYAHEDEALRERLDKHLSHLKKQNLISVWHDRDIKAGTEWKHKIDTYLEQAHLILLLISPDFMASEYCYSIEMRRAMERC
jgi:TIR domain